MCAIESKTGLPVKPEQEPSGHTVGWGAFAIPNIRSPYSAKFRSLIIILNFSQIQQQARPGVHALVVVRQV